MRKRPISCTANRRSGTRAQPDRLTSRDDVHSTIVSPWPLFKPEDTSRSRLLADRPSRPLLNDETYGEHAAAFLSGNFEPVLEEITADYLITPVSQAKDSLASRCETVKCSSLEIIGELPNDFPDGKFIYVGPNPKFARKHYKVWGAGPKQVDPLGLANGWHHWFEGDGMVYAVDFEGLEWNQSRYQSYHLNPESVVQVDPADSAKCTRSPASRRLRYRNRYVRTNSWHDELRHGSRLFHPLMNSGGTSFLPNAIANLLFGGNFLKDSANTALTYFSGKLLALQDTMPPWELDSDTLETKGACTFDGTLPFYVPFTAHPKVVAGSDELMFFGFNPVHPPHCSVGSIDKNGSAVKLKSLWHNAFQGATFMHDFCVTKNYVVLFEGSMNIRPLRMLNGDHPLKYDECQLARFGILKRSGCDTVGDVEWCVCSTAQMVYHFVNAWEDESTGEIIVIGVREDGFFHGALSPKGTREWIDQTLVEGISVPRMHEWRIDPIRHEVTSERWLFDDLVEVPRINDAFTGVRSRFAYGGRIHSDSLRMDAQLKFDAVIKYDLETDETQIYEHGKGRYGMEAQFVPRKHAPSDSKNVEDDGWLILYVHDESECGLAATNKTECVILDAKNIEAGPLLRIVLPSRVPYGAHSLWCPANNSQISIFSKEASRVPENDHRSTTDGTTRSSRSDGTASLYGKKSQPRPYSISKGQSGALFGSVKTGILRRAAGLFVHGWRPCISNDDSNEYALFRAFGFRLTEDSALGTRQQDAIEHNSARDTQVFVQKQEDYDADIPASSLKLYEIEGCGESRRVREVICMLDLVCTMCPCPYGSTRHRTAAALSQSSSQTPVEEQPSSGDALLPYLEDTRTGAKISGADTIISYLYFEYLDGATPSPLVAAGFFAKSLAQFAVDARGRQQYDSTTRSSALSRNSPGTFYVRPSLVPRQPLHLWAYEASPFCSLVREVLSELEIQYVLLPCSRGSPRRKRLMRRTGGTFQVPYLEDPNTGAAMFESACIVEYLYSEYVAQ